MSQQSSDDRYVALPVLLAESASFLSSAHGVKTAPPSHAALRVVQIRQPINRYGCVGMLVLTFSLMANDRRKSGSAGVQSLFVIQSR